MKYANKLFVIIILFIPQYTYTQNDQLNSQLLEVSFDRIFPETSFENLHKAVVDVLTLVSNFQLNSKINVVMDLFLTNIFNSLIALHAIIIQTLKNKSKLLPEDLIYLKNYIAYIKNLFDQNIKGLQLSRIKCIDLLFDEAILKI